MTTLYLLENITGVHYLIHDSKNQVSWWIENLDEHPDNRIERYYSINAELLFQHGHAPFIRIIEYHE